ncbi:MAG TPA: ABC transporter permease [Actinomycetota bacterium]
MGLPAGVPFIAAAGAGVFVALPLAGLIARAPWSRLAADLSAPGVQEAFRLSMIVSGAATALVLATGVPLGLWLARTRFRGVTMLRAVIAVPVVLPPVVGGIALLAAFGRNGLLGETLETLFGLRLSFTTAAAILAGAFVALPFVVLSVEAAARQAGEKFEEAAATMGAARSRVLWRVTLPMLAPSIAAGAALAWARALGEFGATLTFAGSLPGTTETLPLHVYRTLQTDFDGAIALSVMLMTVSLIAIVVLGRRLRVTGSR